jgi:hypothetical protein
MFEAMEKLRSAKSAFEQASKSQDDSDVAAKTAIGLAYMAEALIDLAAEVQEIKALANKARKDRNESSERLAHKVE